MVQKQHGMCLSTRPNKATKCREVFAACVSVRRGPPSLILCTKLRYTPRARTRRYAPIVHVYLIWSVWTLSSPNFDTFKRRWKRGQNEWKFRQKWLNTRYTKV